MGMKADTYELLGIITKRQKPVNHYVFVKMWRGVETIIPKRRANIA